MRTALPPRPPSRIRPSSLMALAAACLIAGCGIRPRAPELSPHPAPADSLPPSTVDVPVTVDLTTAFNELNAQVPKAWPAEGAWTYVNGGLRYKYHAQRTDFALALNGAQLQMGTEVHYRAEAQKKVFFAWVSGSCGHGDEWPRRLAVSFASNVAATPEYGLRTQSTLTDLRPLDPCKVTLLGIDVTPRIVAAVRGPVSSAAGMFDAKSSAFSVRPTVERGWNHLQRPLPAGDATWLVLAPFETRFGGFNGGGTTLSTSLGLGLRPRLVLGAQPAPDSVPLPPLRMAPTGSGFLITADVEIAHEQASRLLTEALRGQELSAGGKWIRVTRATVSGVGSDTLVVRLDFKGDARGRLYLIGRPQLDATTQRLTVPDLGFTVKTRNALVKAAAWLLEDRIVAELRERAQWDLTERLAAQREALTRAVNRDLGDGASLVGEVASLTALGVRAERQATRVRMQASGEVHLRVDPQVAARR